jgi:hypothetical protein
LSLPIFRWESLRHARRPGHAKRDSGHRPGSARPGLDAAHDRSDALSLARDEWRAAFMRVDDSNREALARAGEERRKFQAGLKKS